MWTLNKPRPSITARAISYFTHRLFQVSVPISTCYSGSYAPPLVGEPCGSRQKVEVMLGWMVTPRRTASRSHLPEPQGYRTKYLVSA
jgi:hypothetical protein